MKYAAIFALACMLSAQDDPLPEGEGKKVVQKICNNCHGPENYAKRRLDKDGWESVVSDMILNGATGTDQEFDIVVAYLTNHFGKDVGQAFQPAADFNPTVHLSQRSRAD